MFRLTLVLYSFISATLAGIFIIAVLVVGLDTMMPIIYAAAAGFVVAFPVSWILAKKLSEIK